MRTKLGRTKRINLTLTPEAKHQLECVAQADRCTQGEELEKLVRARYATLRKWGKIEDEERIASEV